MGTVKRVTYFRRSKTSEISIKLNVAVGDTGREKQIKVESHETPSQRDEVFARPFITKGFQLEIQKRVPKAEERTRRM